jgi:cellulose synthase/poly-beta-1,6-N-acetylglucosamine synthase-like glycosyltransferase
MGTLREWAGRAGFLAVSALVLAGGYVQGFWSVSLSVDRAPLVVDLQFIEAAFSMATFAGFFLISGLLFLWHSYRSREPTIATDDGHVAALVPVYGDAGVLHRSVESLLESTYENLTVWIVYESDDQASADRAHELADEHDRIEALENTKYPGSKAGAINYATEIVDAAHIAVFDADERVHPRFVAAAVAQLDDYDVVQGRTIPEPTGVIESIAYYESVLLNFVARRGLYVFTDFRMAASRAVVMRREALIETEGYHTEMLTEDFEFAYRCYKRRLDVTELLAYPSEIEAAHSLRDWWGQRKRWMTGYTQASHYLIGNSWPLTDYRNPLSALIAVGTVGAGLFLLSLMSKFVVLAIEGQGAVLGGGLAIIVAITLAVQVQDYRQGSIDSFGLTWLAIPLLFPLYSLVAIKSMVEYLFTWEGEWYSVSKGVSAD